MDADERATAARLAIGRLFRLGSRPTQDGDLEQYEACRRVILDALDPLPSPFEPQLVGRTTRAKGAPGG